MSQLQNTEDSNKVEAQLSVGQRMLLIWIGLCIGNLVCVPFFSSWTSAFEHSFFQGIALIAVYIAVIRPQAAK